MQQFSKSEAFEAISLIRLGQPSKLLSATCSSPKYQRAVDIIKENIAQGMPTVKLVMGEYGSGKTTLADRLTEFYTSIQYPVVHIKYQGVRSGYKAHDVMQEIFALNGNLPIWLAGVDLENLHFSDEKIKTILSIACMTSVQKSSEFNFAMRNWISGLGVLPIKQIANSHHLKLAGAFDTKIDSPRLITALAASQNLAGRRLAIILDEVEAISVMRAEAKSDHLDFLRNLVDDAFNKSGVYDLYIMTTPDFPIINYPALAERLDGEACLFGSKWTTSLFTPKPQEVFDVITQFYISAYDLNESDDIFEVLSSIAQKLSLTSKIRDLSKFSVSILDAYLGSHDEGLASAKAKLKDMQDRDNWKKSDPGPSNNSLDFTNHHVERQFGDNPSILFPDEKVGQTETIPDTKSSSFLIIEDDTYLDFEFDAALDAALNSDSELLPVKNVHNTYTSDSSGTFDFVNHRDSPHDEALTTVDDTAESQTDGIVGQCIESMGRFLRSECESKSVFMLTKRPVQDIMHDCSSVVKGPEYLAKYIAALCDLGIDYQIFNSTQVGDSRTHEQSGASLSPLILREYEIRPNGMVEIYLNRIVGRIEPNAPFISDEQLKRWINEIFQDLQIELNSDESRIYHLINGRSILRYALIRKILQNEPGGLRGVPQYKMCSIIDILFNANKPQKPPHFFSLVSPGELSRSGITWMKKNFMGISRKSFVSARIDIEWSATSCANEDI